jgi:4-nitrophenyl phosphatase
MLRAEGVEPADEADAVLVGICRGLTYDRLDSASALARDGALLLATNRDATYPVESGREQPGAGAIVAAVEAASGREATVLGKPAPALAIEAMQSFGASPAETLVVGDRLDTDIACARAAGCAALLVLTGVTAAAPPGVDWAPDLSGLGSGQG